MKPIHPLEEVKGWLKKQILIAALILLITALLTMGSWAYLFDSDAIVNTFRAGTVDIEIDENYTPAVDWQGGKYTKELRVKTLGTKCVYVRVSLTPLWGHLSNGDFVAEPSLPVDNVTLTWNQTDWVYQDGWYYYKHILCPDDVETSLLLQKVALKKSITGKEYRGKVLHIVADAEAVQASYGAYKQAWGLENLPAGVEVWSAP